MDSTPKFATIQTWCQISGMGRTTVYREIALGNLRAVKLAGRTLVEVEPGLDWLRSLPSAEIKPQQRVVA